MKKQELLDLAKHAARAATKAGAQNARVKVSRSREVSVEWRDGKLDRLQEATNQGLSVAIYVDDRYSGNSTSDIRKEALNDYVQKAVAATRYLAPDEHRRLPEPARYRGMTDKNLQIDDPRASKITPEDRLSAAAAMEKAARAGKGSERIISVTSAVSDYRGETVCFATNGLEAYEEETYFSRSVSVSIRDGDDRKPSGSSYGATRFLEDLPGPEQLGEEALKRAVNQLDSRQIPTGEYDFVLENRAVPLLARYLLGSLSGSSLQQKRSFLEGRLGELIASKLLTIEDNPHLSRGLSSTAWDSEGMATKPRKIIDQGTLKTFFLNTYYASKLGREPTTGDLSNAVWATGDRDAAAMIKDMKKGIFVTDFLGGNSNATTGDFSLGIKGFYVKNGEIAHPVSEMNIAGNHLDLWKDLVEVGSDPWQYSSNLSPSLRFKAIQFSGK